MTTPRPMLHLFCGKIAAGKSTLAAQIADETGAVLIREDDWLSTLYGDQLTSLADYVRCSTRLQAAMGPHVAGLLRAGQSVVLDFPANTPGQRAWMRQVLDDSGADHQLHLLTPPDEVCLARLHTRNAAGDHPFAATEAQFAQVSKHFSPPEVAEGFNVVPG